jgi:hypothetical protein
MVISTTQAVMIDLTDRYRPDKGSGMMAYLVIDRALGTGDSHFVSVDCPPKFAAALMLS